MAQIWLPDASLTTRRAAEPITKVVESWANEWFASSPWQVLGNWDEASPQTSDDYKVFGRAKGLEITGKAGMETALALAILNAGDETPRTNDDKDLFAKLGKRALKDLEDRIAEFLPAESDTVSSRFQVAFPRVFSLLIGPLGKAQIALECSLTQLVAMTIDTYPQTANRGGLTTTRGIVENLSVGVSARLGSASITLKELAGLEVGDLLILDTKPADAAELMIEGRRSALAFMISETSSQYNLEFREKQ
ncbi:MAG: FliM/FliN family flagellar motor C-terminal domain-containing protein [Erythrobacter sp.]|uniref:FliM/FliN family flagellar motor switch protein n=1 Tax=Erythrobacter sp. TaxID=1042 RepID=UPI003263B641